MKEIDKKMAHRLFTNALITEAVFSSKRFYEDDLIIERLNKVLLIPWNDWALFNFIKKTDQLTIDKQLHAKSLDEICSKFYSAADEDSHTERIKKIEELIGKYGYVNRSPCCFAIFETGKEMDL